MAMPGIDLFPKLRCLALSLCSQMAMPDMVFMLQDGTAWHGRYVRRWRCLALSLCSKMAMPGIVFMLQDGDPCHGLFSSPEPKAHR